MSGTKLGKRAELTPNSKGSGPFAAALRTLAKNAGPDGKDGECMSVANLPRPQRCRVMDLGPLPLIRQIRISLQLF